MGWREHFIATPEQLHPVSHEIQPLSVYLGTLGMTGLARVESGRGQGWRLGGYFKAGKLKHKETVAKGIDQAVDAVIGLFQGQNVGKMVVELA